MVETATKVTPLEQQVLLQTVQGELVEALANCQRFIVAEREACKANSIFESEYLYTHCAREKVRMLRTLLDSLEKLEEATRKGRSSILAVSLSMTKVRVMVDVDEGDEMLQNIYLAFDALKDRAYNLMHARLRRA